MQTILYEVNCAEPIFWPLCLQLHTPYIFPMIEQNRAVRNNFSILLQEVVHKKAYVKVQYYSELHELLKVTSVAKSIEHRNGLDYLLLASGEEIPVAQLVKIADTAAPGHDADDFYNCACS